MYSLESTTALTALADAVRSKTSISASLSVSEMASAVEGISVGSELTIPTLTGDCSYMFQKNYYNWIISNTALCATISSTALTSIEKMFYNSTSLSSIPITLNMLGYNSGDVSNVRSVFQGCENLTSPASIIYSYNTGGVIAAASSLFRDCKNLRELPSDYFNSWKTAISNLSGGYMFRNCFSLREIPNITNLDVVKQTDGTTTFYQGLFQNCYTLNKINDIPVMNNGTNVITSNQFDDTTFGNCLRVNSITFETDNGSAKIAKWGNQVVEIGADVGVAYTSGFNNSHITGYNSGITQAKCVSTTADYALLKNDDDYYTFDKQFSRYNHNSAVETINSLPNTSSVTATNTIKFVSSDKGSLTDGGAINTLTAEEIAQATSKGWTVALS